MPKFAARLNLMFSEWPMLDRFAAARDAGSEAVEVRRAATRRDCTGSGRVKP